MIPLYLTNRRIWLMESASSTPNWNLPMNRSDFKIYRDVWNEVEFVVRNTDRKPINLANKTVNIIIQDHDSGMMLLQQGLIVQDAVRGVVKLSLTPGRTTAWPAGFLTYSVSICHEDGTEKPLMVDQDQRAIGYLELIDGAAPPVIKSFEIPAKSFMPSTVDAPNRIGGLWISGSYPGTSQRGNVETLHTVAIYVTNFTGKIYVEASLENAASPHNEDWFNIALTSTTDYWLLENATGIEAFNFYTNARWVRFLYEPHPRNKGTLDKVLYKN